ncbi:MAG TPA: sugar phosphate nucleotidyltransferase [Vicinamibacteria bacterium]|nr:sugar phosphate nucleotidyltransferase [Vicinamibacteria bacterium]
MKAIVLCAGFGTRMYPLTRGHAKTLLPAAGKPIVGHLVDGLEETGFFEQIVVVSNARFHDRFIAWGESRVVVLNNGVTHDEARLGAVQDLAWTIDQLGVREPVLVAAGDNLFRDTLEPFVTDYLKKPRNLILRYLEPNRDKLRRTGVAEIDDAGRLVRLVEKPESPPSQWACPALYMLQADAVEELGRYVVERPSADALGSFIAWLAPRLPVFTHEMRGDRLDVGDLEGYASAESWLTKGR